jgi:Sugar (and other) transporter
MSRSLHGFRISRSPEIVAAFRHVLKRRAERQDMATFQGTFDKSERTGVGRIVLASLVGTAIEFYDFYIFGTAAALVFGPMFFPKSAPETQTLNAYLTFGNAFLARPVGSFVFGHFGDRIGRKSTLVATMLTMGAATTLIGALPSTRQRARSRLGSSPR